MKNDLNPELKKRRGNHLEAMLRYEELLIDIARGEYSFDKNELGESEVTEIVRETIANCSKCNGNGYSFDEAGEEDNCDDCCGIARNIITNYRD